jgi:hypothetical protein
MLTIDVLTGQPTSSYLIDVPRVVGKGTFTIDYKKIVVPTADGLAAIQIVPPPKESDSSVVWNMSLADSYGVRELYVKHSNQDIFLAKNALDDNNRYQMFAFIYPEKKPLWSEISYTVASLIYYKESAEDLFTSFNYVNSTTIRAKMTKLYSGAARYSFYLQRAGGFAAPFSAVYNPAFPDFWYFSSTDISLNASAISVIDSRFRRSFSTVNIEKVFTDGATRCGDPLFLSDKGDIMIVSCDHISQDGSSQVGTVTAYQSNIGTYKLIWSNKFNTSSCENMSERII